VAGYNAMRATKDRHGLVANGSMLDVQNLMEALAAARPLFHSEADFQHAFAWELHSCSPSSHIRLERPVEPNSGLLHIDVTAESEGRLYVFELKYMTRALVTLDGGEIYALKSHAAQPRGRNAFLEEVTRVESVVQALPSSVACAILLTNDSAYWSESRGSDDTSASFSLTDGRKLPGSLDWGPCCFGRHQTQAGAAN
jgi:hypothetical protein